MLVLFFINAAIILNSYLLARLLFSTEPVLDFIISWFIVFFAQILLILQILGISGRLYSQNIIIASFVFLTAGFLLWRLFSFQKRDIINWQAFKCLSELNKVERLAFSILVGFFIVKLVINLFNAPFGWDNLNYHFTFPVEWLKSDNLNCSISIFGDPSVSYYPINGNLFFFWLLFPLKNVFLADLGQFPFFICAFLATYSIARKLKVSRSYSFLAACLFSLIPNYFKQLKIAYVDIIVAALFLFSLNFLLAAKEKRSLKLLFLSGLSGGMLLGTKTTAMPLFLLLLIGMLLVIFLNFRERLFLALLICGSVILVFGGYSYVHSYFVTGNPLYPLNLRIFGMTIFKGVIDNSVYRTGILPGDFGLRRLLFSEGLGVQTFLFVFPLVLLSPLFAFWKMIHQDKTGYLERYLFILPTAIFLIFRFILPLPNVRYVYCIFAVSLIIALYILEKLSVSRNFVFSVMFVCILASAGEMAKKIELLVSLLFSLVIYLSFPQITKFIFSNFLRKLIVIVMITLISLPFLNKIYIKNEYPSYLKMVRYSGFWPDAAKAWIWLNENTNKDNIAYVGRPVPFPLFGSNFKNNVRYVSINSTEPAMLHYFPNSNYIWNYKNNLWITNFEAKDNYRGKADYDTWIRNLMNNKIEFLFIYSVLPAKEINFPLEDKWAVGHPERFKLVFANNTIHIYRLQQ